jgi:hypothetical protein
MARTPVDARRRAMGREEDRSGRCPTCGDGVLVDIAYREGSGLPDREGEAVQDPDARQVETYSCGHEVVGPRLDATSADGGLEVERRTSEETTDAV